MLTLGSCHDGLRFVLAGDSQLCSPVLIKNETYCGQFFCLVSTRLLLPSCGFVRFLEFLKVVSFYKKKVKWMCCVSTGSKSVKAIYIYR